ncbi:MAG: enoyl-CoA hydratase-related protein [Desulfobacterales bacterium]
MDSPLTFQKIEQLTKPTIAAIRVYPVGGLELALVCDFRIAGNDATEPDYRK